MNARATPAPSPIGSGMGSVLLTIEGDNPTTSHTDNATLASIVKARRWIRTPFDLILIHQSAWVFIALGLHDDIRLWWHFDSYSIVKDTIQPIQQERCWETEKAQSCQLGFQEYHPRLARRGV